MNPLFTGNTGNQMSMMNNFLNNSPIGNIMKFMNEYKRLKSNPSELGTFLYNQKVINKDQLNEINKMNGDPSRIGEYLVNSGSIPQSQIKELQNGANQMQQYINKSSN